MGYFILVKNKGSWLGNSIERHQLKMKFAPEAACYTHVEVSGGGAYSVRVAPPKTKIINILKTYNGRYIKIERFKNEDYERKGRYKVAFWAASHCNLAYDWFGVLRFKIKWLFHFARNYFCSENSLWALQKEFPRALGIKPKDCMPADFLNPKYFEIVWEGKI